MTSIAYHYDNHISIVIQRQLKSIIRFDIIQFQLKSYF